MKGMNTIDNFVNMNIGVLSGGLLSMKGVIKTFILLGGAFGGRFA